MHQKKRGVQMVYTTLLLVFGMVLPSCTSNTSMNTVAYIPDPVCAPKQSVSEQKTNEQSPIQTGWITEQILTSTDGEIHYSYYLPERYDRSKTYPMVVAMPGYDRMWFGEESAGKNLDWNGVQVWTEQDEDIIVVSAQLTDWGEKSARQSIQLTEYMLKTFSVNPQRVYAAGYSAGGETMSQAVSMRPDLYAAYRAAGWPDAQIDEVLKLEIPPDAYFNNLGIHNYHGGGNVLFDDKEIIKWMLNKQKIK